MLRSSHDNRQVHHPYDQCFKLVMNQRLEHRARVALEQAVHVPPQRIDLTYELLVPGSGAELGLVGRMMALGPGMLEYFAQSPSSDGVEECLRKRLNYAHERLLTARRCGDAVPAKPWLWVVSAGQPRDALQACGAEPLADWPAGIWQSRADAWTRIVVLSELPEHPDTLLLRVFGRGRTLARAMTELSELPDDDALRAAAMPPLLAFRKSIVQDLKRTGDMYTAERVQALYEAWEQRALRKGVKQGVKLGEERGEIALRNMLDAILTLRFGSLPSEVSERIEQADLATLERWGSRVATATSLDDVLR